MEWHKLFVKRKELQLLGTLNGGQSFRWKKVIEANVEKWVGVFAGKVWILQQDEDSILYQVHEQENIEPPSKKQKQSDYDTLLKDYFQLNLNLEKEYKKWSEADSNFKKVTEQFYGIRILKQEPVENIFSFICSTNNNITRITSMVEKLALYYGSKICDINGETYYSFPTIEQLNVKGVEEKLRNNGFGYRAKYISKTAEVIAEKGGDKWIKSLEDMDYDSAKKELMTLMGIGAKVADCICLMSLNHLQALPVDTHVFQIAARFYMPGLKTVKTVTDKVYNEIGDYFRQLYGPLAGWAQTVLFCADLKKLQNDDTLPDISSNGKDKSKVKKKSTARRKK